MKAARIDAQEPPRIFRLLRMHIEGQPGCNRFLRELRGGKIDCDDGGDTRLRRLRLSDGRVEILPQFAQQMPHRGQNELVLAAEIMMRKRGRNPRLMCDLRDGHIQRTALADCTDGGIDQLAPPQGLHPDLGHNSGPFSG